MRTSRFSESQIVGMLREAESGVPVAHLLRRHGVSKATFFKWRSKYAGASVPAVKRLRELEAENSTLKRMYADLALEHAVTCRPSSDQSLLENGPFVRGPGFSDHFQSEPAAVASIRCANSRGLCPLRAR